VKAHNVAEILVAIPSASGMQMLHISEACGKAVVPFRAVPSLSSLISGTLQISQLQEINLEELLGREPVMSESATGEHVLSGRVVLVTGAAGSIGSELCRQIVHANPKRLICVDQSETPLFNLQQHVLAESTVDVVYSVTDMTDTVSMRHLLQKHGVEVIFHAAAYKHVPMTEANPYEGLKNNVFGLLDLVETADAVGCEEFVLISSDKAVNPSSLMGCTKRLGELIVGSRPSRMRCVSVRFGNVLGSQGSVIPLFQEQIRTGGLITVTHPQMTRYFMTIPEASALVLQAFTVGKHGDVMVLDMGKPIRIVDLAMTLARIMGKRDTDVQIVYTGMRPGEKLHEELFYDNEVQSPTSIAKVTRAQGELPPWTWLRRQLLDLRSIMPSESAEEIRIKVQQIVPEYEWIPAHATNNPPTKVLARAS
jgi:FlaA1/EpsC-like NDP-sugar epimerase